MAGTDPWAGYGNWYRPVFPKPIELYKTSDGKRFFHGVRSNGPGTVEWIAVNAAGWAINSFVEHSRDANWITLKGVSSSIAPLTKMYPYIRLPIYDGMTQTAKSASGPWTEYLEFESPKGSNPVQPTVDVGPDPWAGEGNWYKPVFPNPIDLYKTSDGKQLVHGVRAYGPNSVEWIAVNADGWAINHFVEQSRDANWITLKGVQSAIAPLTKAYPYIRVPIYGGMTQTANSASGSWADYLHFKSRSVRITGTPTEHQVLTAAHSLASEDGLGAIRYQWRRNGSDVKGATGSTYTLTQADVGTTIIVVVSYIDRQGTNESVSSSNVGPVANVPDAPTGSVTITGTPTEDEILTAAHTLADVDGLGTISYQWRRNGSDISGATGTTYTLTQADVDSTITVVASYTDRQGTNESVSSTGVGPVANVQDAPTGGVTILGTPTEDEILKATHTLADEDGLGAFSYQWRRNGSDITGATGSTHTLTQADVGNTITVVASYTDRQGTNESASSAGVGPVNTFWEATRYTYPAVFPEPTELYKTSDGKQFIHGIRSYGPGTVEWIAVNAVGVAVNSLTEHSRDANWITLKGVESHIAPLTKKYPYVRLPIYDGMTQTANSPTGPWTDYLHFKSYGVTISGTPTEDQILTALHALDPNELGTIRYQWRRNGSDIANAMGNTYALTQADVGTMIAVVARYIDGQGTIQSVSSAGVGPVANVNDVPTGSVTISGRLLDGQILTAANTLADEDGLGAIRYQWQRNGSDITGATGSTHTLTQADVGTMITVVASYTDRQSTNERVSSASVGPVGAPPSAVSGLKVVGATDSYIDLAWDPATADSWPPVAAYNIWVNGKPYLLVDAANAQYQIANLPPRTDLVISIAAQNAFGEGPRTPEMTASTKAPPPGVLADGAYRIQQKAAWRYLDAVESQDSYNEAFTRGKQNDDSQVWILQHQGDGAYTFRQIGEHYHDRYLDAWKNQHDNSAITNLAHQPLEGEGEGGFHILGLAIPRTNSQLWVLESTPETYAGNQQYRIRQKSSGTFLDAGVPTTTIAVSPWLSTTHPSSASERAVTRPAQNMSSQEWVFTRPYAVGQPGPGGGYVVIDGASGGLEAAPKYFGGVWSWQDADRIADQYVSPSGHDDWRLPTTDELYAISAYFFQESKMTPNPGLHWSAPLMHTQGLYRLEGYCRGVFFSLSGGFTGHGTQGLSDTSTATVWPVRTFKF